MPRQTFSFSKSTQPSEQDSVSRIEDPIIDAEKIFRIERSGRDSNPKRSYAFKVTILLFLFTGLLASGGFLMHYLSKNPIGIEDTPKKILPPKLESKPELPTPPKPEDAIVIEMAKKSAEETMADFVSARESLNALGAARWGGNFYGQMEEFSRQADALYLNKEYGPASLKYQQALAAARKLSGESANALGQLIKEGNQALDEGKGKHARTRFSLALMIDPASREAKKGLAGAEKTEALARLLLSGQKNENRNNLPFAFTDYQQAMELDPKSVKVQQAFQRVKARIAEDEFRNLMSRGLTAMHRDDFDGARASFRKARELRPASQEAGDALRQVEQAWRLSRIKRHRKEALDAERDEDWDRALSAYTAALEIDPRVRFALKGKEHSLEMIEINKRIAFYLDKPEILESDKPLERAVQLLSEAEKKALKAPQLKTKVEKLRHLVRTAQTPLTITLESDNLTRVTVYRVGRLGTFVKHNLTVRPGTYTIVGTRNGYKDVRQRIVIKPDQPLWVTVICREKI
jgi:hypothetical protein